MARMVLFRQVAAEPSVHFIEKAVRNVLLLCLRFPLILESWVQLQENTMFVFFLQRVLHHSQVTVL